MAILGPYVDTANQQKAVFIYIFDIFEWNQLNFIGVWRIKHHSIPARLCYEWTLQKNQNPKRFFNFFKAC